MLKGIAKGAALSAALPGVSGGRATICIVSSGVKASKDKKEKKTTEPLGKVKHAEHIGQCSKDVHYVMQTSLGAA